MGKRLLGVLIVLTLTGCSPMVWNKPGATTADFNQDKYDCQQSSMTAAPNVAINTNCNQWTGNCTVQDFNQGNRTQLFNSCMVSKGWSLIKQEQSQSQHGVALPSENTQATARIERAKQRNDESKDCTNKHEDKTFETWKEVAHCKNSAWTSWAKDIHYHWPDLIVSLNATRSQVYAKLDAGKITEEDMKAKMADKMSALQTEELKRKTFLAASGKQNSTIKDTP